MTKMKPRGFILTIVFFLFGQLFVFSDQNQTCVVDYIIDGDTFACGEEHIRLIGIDCPESSFNARVKKQKELGDPKTVVALGKKAKEFVQSILKPGTKVKLEFDVQERDVYGRILAYVWLPDGRMLNEVILEEGYAMLLTIPPNVKYVDRFKEAYQKARANKKGLWKDK
ncbi:MAG: hypothetical protein CH6_0065 [Candidatus Kapaibacterium sp.]|nr:MAG: hypothetical protein CH6_0065 [Candidatus Kapabacteria bacterium]